MNVFDRMRLGLARARYSQWLDFYGVPRGQRRTLRADFAANLNEAAADVGPRPALRNLGSIRRLARDTTREGDYRSAWVSGAYAGLTAMALYWFLLVIAAIYWAEGVVDTGATGKVRSALFPFIGSHVESDTTDGLGLALETGPAPFLLALTVFVLVARPWRSLAKRRQSVAEVP